MTLFLYKVSFWSTWLGLQQFFLWGHNSTHFKDLVGFPWWSSDSESILQCRRCGIEPVTRVQSLFRELRSNMCRATKPVCSRAPALQLESLRSQINKYFKKKKLAMEQKYQTTKSWKRKLILVRAKIYVIKIYKSRSISLKRPMTLMIFLWDW